MLFLVPRTYRSGGHSQSIIQSIRKSCCSWPRSRRILTGKIPRSISQNLVKACIDYFLSLILSLFLCVAVFLFVSLFLVDILDTIYVFCLYFFTPIPEILAVA